VSRATARVLGIVAVVAVSAGGAQESVDPSELFVRAAEQELEDVD
jgi:hypothetical protein